MVKKKDKVYSLKKLNKSISVLEQTVDNLEATINNQNSNHEMELKKLREILKAEEAGYTARITSLESQLSDAYIDQERLNSVILSLGQTIQTQQRILRNRERFRPINSVNQQQVEQMHAEDRRKY